MWQTPLMPATGQPSHAQHRAPAVPGLPSPRHRLIAFSLYDFADSGFVTVMVTVLFSQYYAGTVAGGADGVSLFGRPVPGSSLFAWLISLAMGVVAIAAPFLGVLADRRGSRIRSMAICLLPGIAFSFGLPFVGPGEWKEGAILFFVAYVGLATAAVFYNALLPELGPPGTLGRASGIAWGVGYLGGGLLLVLNLVMLQRPQLLGFAPGRFDLHDCFASAAWWWLVFSVPIFWVFRYEDRARRAARSTLAPPERPDTARSEAVAVLAQVRRTLARIVRLRQLPRFFLAYLFYNDAVQTIVATASIFGAQVLGMKPAGLILLFLLVQATAFVGALLVGRLADRWGHRQALLLCVVALGFFTTWGAAVGVLGRARIEYWIVCGVGGLFFGGIQTCSRSWLAQWVPAGRESEIFGFFSIVSRVAAILGPAVFGAVGMATGSLRWAVASQVVFLVLGAALLLGVRPAAVEEEREALAASG